MSENVLSGKRVFITGATGFVGPHLCERLLKEGAEVVAFLRKMVWRRPKNILHLKNQLEMRYGNLRDYGTLLDATKDIDIIFHLAAQTHVPDSVGDPLETFEVNAIGTLNCLEAARKNDIDLFINSGTAKICGDPLYLPFDEKHPNLPHAPYDASKIAAESLCMAYYKTYGLKVCMPRFTNTYGPRLDRRKVVADLIYYLLRNEPPVIRSDGTPIRDYIYIDDVIEAYMKLVEKPNAVGEVFLIGSGVGTSVLDLCNLLIEVSQTKLKPIILGQPIPGEIQEEYVDISKAKKLLGWLPKIDLRTGLSITWEWFNAHPEFLEE